MNFAQITISGKIVNENNEPLPFVHLRIENTSIGTISNNFGFFKLKFSSNIKNNNIVISRIGYQTKKVLLNEVYHVISLTQNVTELNEVIVVSKDYGKELILNAIKAIPNNYPREDERHRGFLRETTIWEEEGKPIYEVEAVIETVKKAYTRRHQSGAVHLKEFRVYESNQLDSLNLRIYAGSHHIHRFDIVSRREAFLKNPNNFEYKIVDTIQQQDRNIYKIHFENKNKLKGHVYVMDSSYAIIKAEFNHNSFFDLPPVSNRQYLNYTVTYEQAEDKMWRFKHSYYKTAFKKRGKLLKLVSNYITTKVEKNETDISYSDRLQFGDILLDQSKEYNSDFWNNYNILLPDKESDNLFKSIDYSQKKHAKRQSSKLRNILQRIKQEIAFKWTSIENSPYKLSYINSAFELQQDGVFSKKTVLGFTYSLLYEIKPNFFLGYANESRITKNGVASHDLAISRSININSKGRPILISPSLKFGYQEINLFIGSNPSTEDFKIKGTSFDSDKTNVFLSQRNFHIQPNITLSIEKSHKLDFFLSAGYNFLSKERTGLLFHEKNVLSFFRKKKFLKNDNENLLINHSGSLFQNNISISAGIVFGF